MLKAPYDEKNAADYIELSNRITSALKVLEDNPIVPATEKVLAQLAGCSRGTLRNRVYPLDQLKHIKSNRKKSNSEKKLYAPTLDVESHISEERRLQEQLRYSRSEVAVWVEKYKELESGTRKLQRANEMLQAEKAALSNQREALLKKLQEGNVPQAPQEVKNRVIDFRKPKRSRKSR